MKKETKAQKGRNKAKRKRGEKETAREREQKRERERARARERATRAGRLNLLQKVLKLLFGDTLPAKLLVLPAQLVLQHCVLLHRRLQLALRLCNDGADGAADNARGEAR